MKISYNWLKSYLDFNLVPNDLAEILTNTGLEVESVELFETVQGGLDGVVIGEVISCEKHPDADRLQITKVDIGSDTPLQIVCGAPNCRVGLKSPVALIGATLYPTSGEKFQIKKSKIRGVESQGMICADDELGLGSSHAGIMELTAETPVGTPAATYFKVEKDYVFEIGLTPNRSDAFSHIGVARDLSAALSAVYKIDLPLQKPIVALGKPTVNSQQPTQINVEDSIACPRYSGITIDNIKVAESPDWLKNRLKAIGIRAINNVVDITNYVLHEYGQPLHAFDAAKIRGSTVVVKKLPEGKAFKGLDGIDRKLSAHDLMICDAEGPMCIAGVFGGIDSGVSESTTSVFIESAHFDAITVRKTAARHNLRTDAAMHFEKICDINITVEALKRAASLIVEICGGEVSSDITDIYPNPIAGYPIQVSLARINRLVGTELSAVTVKNILSKLEIHIEKEEGDILYLLVPTFKADVKREADIVEEILRIYGYNNIPMPKSLRSNLSFVEGIDYVKLENTAADWLTGHGFHEISTNSVSQSKYEQDKALQKQQVLLLNSQTAELDTMRTSMLYSALEVIACNQNRKNATLRLYEIGKTYHRIADAYAQQQHLVLYLTGNAVQDSWLDKSKPFDFFHLKSYITQLLHRFGVGDYERNTIETMPFTFGSQLMIEGKVLATFGLVEQKLLKQFDIKQEVFYADINWDLLTERSSYHRVQYSPLPKYPAVQRDLAMLADDNLRFEQIEQLAYTESRKLLKEVSLFDVYKGDKIDTSKKSYAVSFTFQDTERTLTDADIDKVMQKLMQKLEKELGVQVRK